MTLDEIQSHRLYKLLDDSEQKFCLEYFRTGGDPEQAALAAYGVAEGKSAKAKGLSVLKRPEVLTVINIYYGINEPTQEEFLQFLWAAIKKAESGAAQTSLLTLYATLRGWKANPKPADNDKLPDLLKLLQE